ncbi:MAG: alpha/beta fold hydrolase [Candidatus Acidiferrales bacterium]|jgi:pimeloyl-ACP methyl ester carboxylesterase
MRRLTFAFCASLLLTILAMALPSRTCGQEIPAAVTSDPAPDKANPAAMEAMQLPSHGALLNAIVYIASGVGPHPVAVLLHGYPGNEKNLDLAQAIRRAGWDVLYFDYRGSWGSPGSFSFTHCIEDTEAAVAYLRDPANARKLRADSAHIVLIGHSMGGFMASFVGAEDPSIEAVGMISAANLGAADSWPLGDGHAATVDAVAAALADSGMAPLAGCTPEGLAREVIANQTHWNFVDFAPKRAARPILVVTSDDGLAPTNNAFLGALKKSGAVNVAAIHMPTDHGYSDHRIALETAVLTWLASLPSRQMSR